MDAGRVRGSHCATSAGPVPCPLSPTFPISASARRSQMGREGKWPWGWGRETQLDITPRVYFYLTAGCLSGRVRWPCQSHRRGRCLPTGTHVRAGTWSLGPRQGRRQPWPTAPLFLHLLPHLRQTPGLPRCLREPPQGASGGGLPEQCARMRRLWAVHIASRGGVFSLSVWPSRLHVSPSCHHWETGHQFSTWSPPNVSRLGHTSPCPWWRPLRHTVLQPLCRGSVSQPVLFPSHHWPDCVFVLRWPQRPLGIQEFCKRQSPVNLSLGRGGSCHRWEVGGRGRPRRASAGSSGSACCRLDDERPPAVVRLAELGLRVYFLPFLGERIPGGR